MSEIVLSVKELCKTYRVGTHRIHALRNVSFNLLQGEMLAIMGMSGSGMSTLLNILGVMDKPDRGRILLQGKDITDKLRESQAIAYRSDSIGFIYQSYHLLKNLTVEDNIALPLIMKELDCQYILSEVNSMLALLGLEKWRSHRPIELSGSQQQRVAIGRALISNPALILADAPIGNLANNATSNILTRLHQIKQEKERSIIIVTHDAYVASQADRVLFFHDGFIFDEWLCTSEHDNLDIILRKTKGILEGVV